MDLIKDRVLSKIKEPDFKQFLQDNIMSIPTSKYTFYAHRYFAF